MPNSFNAAKILAPRRTDPMEEIKRLEERYNYLIDVLSIQIKMINAALSNGLSIDNGVLTLGVASATASGALSSTDWGTFNGKQDHSNELDALAALADTVGFVKKTGDGTYSIDINVYATDSNAIAYAIALGG